MDSGRQPHVAVPQNDAVEASESRVGRRIAAHGALREGEGRREVPDSQREARRAQTFSKGIKAVADYGKGLGDGPFRS